MSTAQNNSSAITTLQKTLGLHFSGCDFFFFIQHFEIGYNIQQKPLIKDHSNKKSKCSDDLHLSTKFKKL